MSMQPLIPARRKKILSLTTSIVEENGLTCLMVTHNMQSPWSWAAAP